jgi:hypothetical protein
MEDHEERAGELMKEADRLAEKSEELKEEIKDTKADWDAKKGDPLVPGAVEEDEQD